MSKMPPVKEKPVKKDIVEQVKEEAKKELKRTLHPHEVETKAPGIPFLNLSRFRFIDISSELFREYIYPNGSKLTINNPLKLSVAKNNAHRLFDSSGLSYYIPPNWISIVWKARPGAPNFIM